MARPPRTFERGTKGRCRCVLVALTIITRTLSFIRPECLISSDERQWVPPIGQRWTTLYAIRGLTATVTMSTTTSRVVCAIYCSRWDRSGCDPTRHDRGRDVSDETDRRLG
jgi:hypothetical protein